MALVTVAAAVAARTSEACVVTSFKPAVFPATGAFELELVGDGLPPEDQVEVRLFKLSDDVPASERAAAAVQSRESSYMLSFPSANFDAGELYGARVVSSSNATVFCSLAARPGFAHAPIMLTTFGGRDNDMGPSSLYNVAGQRDIVLRGTGIIDAKFHPDDTIVRYRDPSGTSIGLDRVAAEVISVGGELVVASKTQPVPTPLDWLLSCPDANKPVKSATCVPDISLKISFSLNGGLTFTNELDITFGYVPPLKAAFLFVGPVDDFGWTYQLNEGRVRLESRFGATINASTYYEYLLEGEFEQAQANKGSTIATGTPVPEFVIDSVTHMERPNLYYPALQVMKRLCDEDFDIVFTGSFGLQTQTVDVSSGYAGCAKAGDGSDPDAAEYSTHFMNTGGYLTTPRMSTGFAKIYQMRYLSGLVAGYELKRRAFVRSTVEDDGMASCVGYIAAYPLPEVQRGINAFTIGCREVYPECTVKVAWSGVWHDTKIETNAAAFMWNVGKCELITQHSDTAEPQRYYRDRGGAGLGYNSDTRSLVGDSVLISAILNWAPVFEYYIEMVRNGNWNLDSPDQIWLGVDDGAVKLAPYFSPAVPADVQAMVLRRKAELEALEGAAAFFDIFCGDIKAHWVYARDEAAGGVPYSSCTGQPEWKRHDVAQSLNPQHFVNKNTWQNLPAGGAITADDCLFGVFFPGQALLQTAWPLGDFDMLQSFSDYLVEGVELFQPQVTPFGTIHAEQPRTCDVPFDAFGHLFYTPPIEYPECSKSNFAIRRGECDPTQSVTPILYNWTVNNDTGLENICGTERSVSGKILTPAELPYLEVGPGCDYVAWGSAGAGLVAAFAILGMLLNGCTGALIIRFRRHTEVRKTQPLLVVCMAVGATFLNASTLLFIGKPTATTCLARVWGFNLGFDFVFAFMWSRIYRVFVLFKSTKKMRRVLVKDTDMVQLAAVLTLVDAVILTVWSLVDPPMPRVIGDVPVYDLPADGVGHITYSECESAGGTFMTATLMYKVFLILSACYLVFASKNVPSTYVEHKFIIFAAYNTAVFSGVILLLTLNTSGKPVTAALIHSAGVTAGSFIIVGALALPRIGAAMGYVKTASTTNNSSSKYNNGAPTTSAVMSSGNTMGTNAGTNASSSHGTE